MVSEDSIVKPKIQRRPRSSRGPRSVIIRTKVTPEEVVWLDGRATYLGLSLSAYTRQVILDKKLPPPPLSREAIEELRAVGNELDQAVGTLRWACGQGRVQDDDLEFFEERCCRLYAFLKDLLIKLEAT